MKLVLHREPRKNKLQLFLPAEREKFVLVGFPQVEWDSELDDYLFTKAHSWTCFLFSSSGEKIWRWQPNPCSLSLRTSPATIIGMGPYGISSLCKLSLIVKADWMNGGHPTQVEPSQSLFPEYRIRILRCWPDSAECLGQALMWNWVSGRTTKTSLQKGKHRMLHICT